MIYAELYKRDIKRKEKQEQEILEEQKKKVYERNTILAFQKVVYKYTLSLFVPLIQI